MSLQKEYRTYCQNHLVSIFQSPEWLDMIDPHWKVLVVNDGGEKIFFPFVLEKKMGFTFIRNSFLTPYAGWIYTGKDTSNTCYKNLVEQLINKLPSFDIFNIDLHPNYSKLTTLPPFSVTNKKTNLLELGDAALLYAEFKPALQRQIKKANRHLFIKEENDIDLFYSLYEKTFLKQHQKTPIPFSFFNKAWHMLSSTKQGRLFFINDEHSNTHAALLLAYDHDTAYYLAGGTDAQFYGSGAMSALMWHAIQESCLMKKKYFDFEGSMLPNVDRFFKNFNPKEVSYLNLQKTQSLLFKLLKKK